MVINRFDVYLVKLDPTVGHEIRKLRPCLIISPNELNHALETAIVAPLTSKSHPYSSRTVCQFQGKQGFIVLDQIRTVDHQRLVKKLGRVDRKTAAEVLQTLQEMFAA